ncbi:MAG: NTP transferase domain-containing protein [Candidatus Odinarchaeota archaeon]
MQIPVIIMAGGKGKRFNFDIIKSKYQEKPLLLLDNKYMIEYVIEAVLNAKNINKVIIGISPFTPQTKSILNAKKLSIEIIDTPGIDYHSDISFVIKKLKFEITMIIAADIPLIKPEFLDEIIDKYFLFEKPALSVMAHLSLFEQNGLKPTNIVDLDEYCKNLVPLGINIIDGRLIEEPELNQAILISEKEELLYNINTVEDYFRLIKYCKKREII